MVANIKVMFGSMESKLELNGHSSGIFIIIFWFIIIYLSQEIVIPLKQQRKVILFLSFFWTKIRNLNYSKSALRATNLKVEEPDDGNKPTIIRLSIWFGWEYTEYSVKLLKKGENSSTRGEDWNGVEDGISNLTGLTVLPSERLTPGTKQPQRIEKVPRKERKNINKLKRKKLNLCPLNLTPEPLPQIRPLIRQRGCQTPLNLCELHRSDPLEVWNEADAGGAGPPSLSTMEVGRWKQQRASKLQNRH